MTARIYRLKHASRGSGITTNQPSRPAAIVSTDDPGWLDLVTDRLFDGQEVNLWVSGNQTWVNLPARIQWNGLPISALRNPLRRHVVKVLRHHAVPGLPRRTRRR
jgi:hypothetical protein